MFDFTGQVALITGGSRGIGRAISRQFARAGADIVINYCADRESAEAVRQEALSTGVRAATVQADLAESGQVESMVASAVKAMGRLDILVNNAGIWEHNPITALSETRLKKTINTNLMGCFYAIMHAVPYMVRQKAGTIINIASTAGQRGEPFYSPYAATKGALIALTKSLAPELAGDNIRVNCVAPGWVETDMTIPTLQSDMAEDVLNQIPMGRVGSADEIAWPVLFLASDMAGFITGEIFNVNGGAVLCG